MGKQPSINYATSSTRKSIKRLSFKEIWVRSNTVLQQIELQFMWALRYSLVACSLYESSDVFTREDAGVVTHQGLPACEVGDLIVFHDAGTYSASMSSNYNARPLIPDVLVDGDELRLIRRRQTIQELMGLEMIDQ